MSVCIFDKNKICTEDCDECFKCEYDPNKICDNCGKCLGIDGLDMRSVKIEEVAENKEESELYMQDLDNDQYISSQPIYADYKEGNDTWEFIDDIKELTDLIIDDDNFIEEFPGLLKIRPKNN